MRNSAFVVPTAILLAVGQPSFAQNQQTFDPFAEQSALFTASVGTMLWLGAAQGVIEACNGDVVPVGEKFINFADAAEAKLGKGYSQMLGGIFGEGLIMGRGVGCSIDKYRLYEGWADITYEPLLNYFDQRK